MNYDWSWSIFGQRSLDGVHTFLESILIGTGWTLALALCAWIFALGLGLLFGIGRTVPNKALRLLSGIYVEFFRGIPLLVQMFLWYFVMPEVIPSQLGNAVKGLPAPWAQFLPALACLSLYQGAHVTEIVRSGVQSVARGQKNAAVAMGFSFAQVYRYVILPQAFRLVVPPLTSQMMSTVKSSSVAMTIGLLELTGAARSMQEFSFHVFEAFSAATLIYLVLNVTVVQSVRRLDRLHH
ncbi:amino acid ABC transporter permease [Variovorax sp. J22G21]|uniref:amino acid ABC transporter permease n=1 Tax=Variovorax fucosicus TaxID=3053517 RepID=UPI002574C2FD|nr:MULTISPECIES: amino acid ABC transporter permease [unclassified Variovorax]MDM0041318.1 amino acid ABC transporter permease [Variovorax sp. J22R193]MDM0060375.1 amino acid ABC transporter permease [Variovorax sp. J22G21]